MKSKKLIIHQILIMITKFKYVVMTTFTIKKVVYRGQKWTFIMSGLSAVHCHSAHFMLLSQDILPQIFHTHVPSDTRDRNTHEHSTLTSHIHHITEVKW